MKKQINTSTFSLGCTLTILAFFAAGIVFMFYMACTPHIVKGVVEDKVHINAKDTLKWDFVTQQYVKHHRPGLYYLTIKCQCGNSHKCLVEYDTWKRYSVGQSVKQK